MNDALWIRIYRTFFGVLAIWAVIAMYYKDGDTVANWVSKFTAEVNAYTGLILLGGAWLGASVLGGRRWESLRGAAVVYLIITFFVYGFLIREFDNPFNTTRHWTHTVLHQLMPLVVVIDLFVRPFVHQIKWRTAVTWTIFPLVYFSYSLIRGAITDWYPYDFINPDESGGYGGVALYFLGILAGFMLVSALVIGTSRLQLPGHWHEPTGSLA
jgi:hypothetical protein